MASQEIGLQSGGEHGLVLIGFYRAAT